MNKLVFTTIFLFFLLGCKKALKDVNDYYPVVETVSATINDDGSVLVEGQIKSNGEAPVDLLGFCMSKEPFPSMEENQINEPKIIGNRFSGVYKDLDLDTRYYFRTWANNSFGYTYGNIIFLDSIKPAYIKPPCSPDLNTFILGSNGVKPVANVFIYKNHVWEVQFFSSGIDFYLTFSEKPKTGIYKTTELKQPEKETAYLKVVSGIAGVALEGQNIYVNRLPTGEFEISICSVEINYGFTVYFTAKFICPGQ
jgi:hypothetical protein